MGVVSKKKIYTYWPVAMTTGESRPMNYGKYITENTLRCEASFRGGGIEIDCKKLFPDLEDARMSAYQNYLGGGMLGAICVNSNFYSKLDTRQYDKYHALGEALKKYFHDLTNHEDDEWENQSYEQNQKMPVSAY